MDKSTLELLGTDPSLLNEDELKIISDQLSGLTGAQLSGLTGDQLSWLTRDQRSGITIEDNKIPKVKNLYSQIFNKINNESCSIKMDQVHTCETTHCIAGWTIFLCGQEGKDLEQEYGWELAARKIHEKNYPKKRLPYYYASNEAALAYVEARALEEREK